MAQQHRPIVSLAAHLLVGLVASIVALGPTSSGAAVQQYQPQMPLPFLSGSPMPAPAIVPFVAPASPTQSQASVSWGAHGVQLAANDQSGTLTDTASDADARERQRQAAMVVAREPGVQLQIDQAITDHYKDQFLISSDYLESVAENIKIATDLISDAYDLQPLLAAHPLPAALQPAADRLRKALQDQTQLRSEDWLGPDAKARLGQLSQLYDLVHGIESDLNASLRDPGAAGAFQDARQIPMAVVRSDTLKAAVHIGLDTLLDADRLQQWADDGKLGETFARRAGFFGFGAGDLAEGVLGVAGGKHWGDADTFEKLLDGVNRILWGTIGAWVTPGDAETKMAAGRALGDVAVYTAQLGRAALMPVFVAHYAPVDALVGLYTQAQTARQVSGKPVVTIETFYRGDRSILDLIGAARLAAADHGFGLQHSADALPVEITSRFRSESYNETCRPYVCVRTDLTRISAAPSGREGGVRINPAVEAVGSPPAEIGRRVLGACAGASGPVCDLH